MAEAAVVRPLARGWALAHAWAVMSARSHRRIHERARGRGASGSLYVIVRGLLALFMRLWFRVRVSGAEHVPAEGAAIIAPNHKSFLDAFFVGLATRRRVRFMAKEELFRGPLGWLFVRLGAFPVRRGKADAEALETSQAILAQGGVLVVFPEGTRVEEPDALGSPHHGAGRLSLASGAPIVPAAIAGTSKLWLGPFPKPRRVQVSFLPPVPVTDLPVARETLTELIDEAVWPAVQREYGRLQATPGAIVSALVALGLGGALLARRQRRAAATPRLLGVVAPRRARRRSARDRLRDLTGR
jgi:1-acyl-sn-glycerol-3-phosphate acyltransferase